jgi:acyl-CoA-binding protein
MRCPNSKTSLFFRHFFYHALKRNLVEDKFVLSQNQLTKLHALIRQVEQGDVNNKDDNQASTALNAWERDIRQEHEKLKGTSESVAKLKFISILAETEFYFCQWFKVKLGGEKLYAAVGATGLTLINRRTPHSSREV